MTIANCQLHLENVALYKTMHLKKSGLQLPDFLKKSQLLLHIIWFPTSTYSMFVDPCVTKDWKTIEA